jgi:hypothetical protein
MSRIAFNGNALGTGTVTIASPNTNSDRTVTLPDETGTVVLSGGALGTPSSGNGSNLTNLNASNLASGTVAVARLAASGTPSASTFLRGDSSWAAAGSTADVQTFNSTGTWTKPTAGQTMARIQIWGGGGGGGRSTGANQGMGGGGGYNEVTVPLSYLAGTVTTTVAAGGNGATSSANGATGGTSQITLSTAWNGRTLWQAFGGGGGQGTGAGNSNGGGGGPLSAGSFTTSGCTPGTVDGTPASDYIGGGVYPDSLWGGGRGGKSGVPAGVSLYAGNGGTGGSGAGTQPSGGGGSGSANQNGGNGAAGRIVITSW